MKKALLLLALIVTVLGLNAQGIGTYKIISYSDYEIQYTVTKVSPAECSVKGINLTSENAIDLISVPETMEIEGKEFTVTSVAAQGFEYFYSVRKFELPNTITTIGSRAFYYCNFATEIAIPESVRAIGNEAFYGCEITEAIIPSGVTKINNSVFRNCRSLANVVIPNTVTSIGSWVFTTCLSLTEIELPESIQSISDYAFSGCSNLSLVTCYAPVPEPGNNMFYNTAKDLIIRVPAEHLNAYKLTEGWNKYDIRAIGAEDETEDEESINENAVALRIYPNPVNDQLIIETEVEISDAVVYDVYGRQHDNMTTRQQGLVSINVSDLSNGVYFVKVVTNDGEVVKRFVKE